MMTRSEFLRSMLGFGVAAGGLAALVGAGCASDSDPHTNSPDATSPPIDGHVGSNTGSGSGSGSGSSTTVTSCTANGTAVTIGGNHGHVLVVSKAHVAAGAARTYDIMGSAAHTHSVTVTAAMFTRLQSDTTQMVTSSLGASHTHVITIVCA